VKALLVTHHRRVQGAADVMAWVAALAFGWLLRVDFAWDDIWWRYLAAAAVGFGLGQLLLGSIAGLYSGRHSFGSFEEVAGLAQVMLAVTTLGFAVNIVSPESIPRSLPVIGGALALVTMCGYRYVWRLYLERQRRPSRDAVPVLVFGAGEGGSQLVTSMLRDPNSLYTPVGLLDDDITKSNLRLRGIRVIGTRSSMAAVARGTGATALAIAIPSAGAQLIREVSATAEDAGLHVLVLPPVSEMLGSQVGVGQLRTLTELDLLGRHEIDTDVASVAGYLTGRRVLVTGAGGSIGSELCRQIYKFSPSELILLDRDESAIHAVQLSIHGRALLDGDDLIIADIRDADRMYEVFELHRPEVVFHAAALKHLPLLEKHPTEGIKTNVYGTLNVLEAARKSGVDRFVNISTDKAADPTSVLGFTKRIAERLTSWAAEGADGGTFLSVRFGNVLGSRGSVLTAFRKQIEDGGPVTVTDPDVTRYFMTVEEAVQLVIQAGAIGRSGEALVLDMGEPVSIAEVAHRLIAESGKDIEIEYTGMREGEKLHEVLLGADEIDDRPVHPLISHVVVPVVNPADLTLETIFATGARS
jgi:FlaA1/EpsC-like NDP-sugar epimerase